ncbi:hypothetical protein [Actinomadura alba]|uniref:Uncharacterized protein n=1 Tax=Actinomadura alba TaxID=406431 RepID=A0ABR7LV88_9ACTN|nr:hypothetical protein [Actinomadura alba]MBC6468328.1 hypothetical protein [Actinomadura alba]
MSRGRLVATFWTSGVEPGHVVDIEAARTHVLPAGHPNDKTLPVPADPGYRGAGHCIIIPFEQAAAGSQR